jgi:hypothetical protein
MKVRDILIILIIIIAIILFFVINPFKKNEETRGSETTVISSLADLFPSKTTTFKYQEGNNKYNIKVTDISENDGVKTITTEEEINQGDEKVTLTTKYEVSDYKVIESGEYKKDGEVVSTIYPLEIINGSISQGYVWKSVDGLTTNTVTSMVNNQVTIESTREVLTYAEGATQPTKSVYKETRVFEKGKGIVNYKTEIVGNADSVTEKKMI